MYTAKLLYTVFSNRQRLPYSFWANITIQKVKYKKTLIIKTKLKNNSKKYITHMHSL